MSRAMLPWEQNPKTPNACLPCALVLVVVGNWACSPPSSQDPSDTGLDADQADSDTDRDGSDDPQMDVSCADGSHCDDSIQCTEDVCGFGGVCRHEAFDSRCPSGQRCVLGQGCTDIPCTGDEECDDGVFCNGTERCMGDSCFQIERSCDDGYDCTEDYCSVAADRCVHDPIPGCEGDGGVDGGTDPFDPDVHYSGDFRVFGLPSSDCFAATYNITELSMTTSQEQLSVIAGRFNMTGSPRPTGDSFDVTHTQTNCGQYRMTGTFVDANNFSGRWTAAFSGTCYQCQNQDAEIFGVRQP